MLGNRRTRTEQGRRIGEEPSQFRCARHQGIGAVEAARRARPGHVRSATVDEKGVAMANLAICHDGLSWSFAGPRSRGRSPKGATVAAGVSQERDELATHPSVGSPNPYQSLR